MKTHQQTKNIVHYNKPPAVEHQTIRRWLLRRLKLLENPNSADSGKQYDRITAKHFPELFNPSNSFEDGLLWTDILTLSDLGIVKLEQKTKKRDPYAPPWQSARITFQTSYESNVRQWLDCPRVSPAQAEWTLALDKVRHQFADTTQLTDNPFSSLDKSPTEILNRLLRIPEKLANKPMTACQLSAEIMWGNSKLLKDKEDWLLRLFALQPQQILSRPMLLEICFPRRVANGLLLIENMDSYIAAADGLWPTGKDLILIYMQGYKATTRNLRDPQRVRFHVHNKNLVSPDTYQEFTSFWFGTNENKNWLTYAITDMDWSGMDMFRGLKLQFPNLEPWKPGYKAMLKDVQKENYHSAADANKSGQDKIHSSGSSWLDENVLPRLQEDKFVDQESIHLEIMRPERVK